ncbi:Phage minor structural protein GP20 [uncultured Anaerotruncus sp.]|uniref:Phage minor structural protein GP20 n=1 Tax=uncultured Anaerotruncus sp. TaxID=905011 RepID=A0A6N2R7X3_9FIRM
MLEKIKELLGEELTTQVEAALKGKGKDGKDIDLVIGNDGSYVPAEKVEAERQARTSAEAALKDAAAALKDVGGSGDPAKIADDVKTAQTQLTELENGYKQELASIKRTSAIKLSLAGKVHDPEDIIKLLDMGKIELDDAGNLKAPIDDLIKPIKESKPYLFVEDKPAESTTATTVTGVKPAETRTSASGTADSDMDQWRTELGLK